MSPIVLFLLIFLFPQILLGLNFDSPFINSLVFRDTSALTSMDQLKDTMSRGYIWKQYLDLYTTSPIIGVSTEMLSIVGQSETMFFSFLAQHGLALFFLVLFMYSLMVNSLKNDDLIKYSMSVVFVLFMLTYSSYLQPYNFIYLLVFGTIKLDMHKEN